MIERLRRAVERLRGSSLRVRILLAAALLGLVAAGATLLWGGALDERPARASAEPQGLRPGQVVRTPDGKILRGPDGKPARVGKDGRTLVDSKGRPLRDSRGKPLRLGADGNIPKEALKRHRKARRHRGHRRRGRRGVGSRLSAKAPARLGLVYSDPEQCRQTQQQHKINLGACPDGRAVGNAVASYVNATGGVAGRRLEMRYHKMHDDGRLYDAQLAEACEHFAAGDKPIGVIRLGIGEGIARCLEARGIAYLGNAPIAVSTGFLDAHPAVFNPQGLAYDRWPDDYVAVLKRAGFFGPGTRVGFGYARGMESLAAGEHRMKRALRAAGANVVAEAGIELGRSRADIAPGLRDIANAVVRFRLADVNRIVTADLSGGVGLAMRFAEAQGYRPLYGLSTTNGPTGLIANAPKEQLENAVAGIGWSPLLDVDEGRDPTNPPERRECVSILRGAGVPVGARNVLGALATITICDAVLLARSALNRSGNPTVAGLRAGLEGIGRDSAMNLATRIDRAHHDGASGYRFLRYSKNCGCMHYQGSTEPID